MPDLDNFKNGVLRRSCPIKALLLDQSFSAGVGNWVAGKSYRRPLIDIPVGARLSLTVLQTRFYIMPVCIRRSDVTS